MFNCPIEYVKDNLIFASDKSCWALYEIAGFDYDMLSVERKIAILNRLTLLISNIVDEAKFMIIPCVQDMDAHFERLVANLDPADPLSYYAASYAEGALAYLKETAADSKKCDYRTYISIKLVREGESSVANSFKDLVNFYIKAVFTDINAIAGLDTRDIPKSRILDYEKLSRDVHRDQSRRLALNPCSSGTVWWILRRAMFRGLPEDSRMYSKQYSLAAYGEKVELAGQEFLRPRRREMSNLFSGAMTKKRRHLELSHEKSTSYQTFLSITSIPNELSFPDCEWIYFAQQLNQQAEVYIHIKNTEHRESIRKIDLQRRQANSQLENIEKANAEVPEDLFESKDEIIALELELKENRSPICNVAVTVCLAADNEEDLDESAAIVRKEYEDLNFTVERPLADQTELFFHVLPCVSFTVSDFIMKMTPQTLASGIIGATRQLGDHVGLPIGHTLPDGKNVFLSLGQACLQDKSASTTFYGNLGVGKSFNANLLVFLHVIFGAYGLIIDPKGERAHWIDSMPMLDGLINLVTLTSDPKYKGMLDPYNVFRDNYAEAGELAVNILAELFKINPKDEEYTAILAAKARMGSVAAMAENGDGSIACTDGTATRPSMELLADILDSFPKDDELAKTAKGLARRIRLQTEGGMAQLLVGNGCEGSIELNNRLNILLIQNLKMPSHNTSKEDYTQEENISIVIMMVMTAFIRRFVFSHKNRFKIVLFDESWMLGKTTEGEKIMSFVARMSRSLYASLILNGHSVTDLPNEGIRNSITYKFCFLTGTIDEAERMLDFLKLERTKENIGLLTTLGNAQCLFQDLAGRVGILQFDAIFQDIIDIFSTTPVEQYGMMEKDGKDYQDSLLEASTVGQTEAEYRNVELFPIKEGSGCKAAVNGLYDLEEV